MAEVIAQLNVDARCLKSLRESLCMAQAALNHASPDRFQSHVRQISGVIAEIDRHRPLGPDGKHRSRHTKTCGCEDKTLAFAGTETDL